MVELNIPKDICGEIVTILEIYFFQNIRDDPDIDNIEYVIVEEEPLFPYYY